MKVVLIGCVKFTYKMLEALLLIDNVDVCGLVTKKKSDMNSDFFSLDEIAIHHNIPTFYFSPAEDVLVMESWLKEKNPTVIFCLGWSHILPLSILNISQYGVIGYHPAALPQNRGRHPIIWALALGLKQTASTFFQIDGGVDSGAIIEQQFIDIDYKDNARSLYNKLTETACTQLKNICFNIQESCLKFSPQNNGKSSYWRKRTEKDGCIDWRMTSFAIYNLVRALSEPYLGAHFIYQGKKVIVWEVEEVTYVKQENLIPGVVIDTNNKKIIVKTYDSAISLLRYDFFGSIPSIGDYLL